MTHAQEEVCLVLGVHRSGTSAIANGLSLLGYCLGEDLLPAQEGVNPKGFFEDSELVRLNEEFLRRRGRRWDSVGDPLPGQCATELEPELIQAARGLLRRRVNELGLYAAKDPRLALTLPVWIAAAAAERLPIRLVIALRSPEEVVASLATRNGFGRVKATLLWLDNFSRIMFHSMGQMRYVVDYPTLLENPAQVLRCLGMFLRPGWRIDDAKLEYYTSRFLDKSLRHHANGAPSAMKAEGAPMQVSLRLYEAIKDEMLNGLNGDLDGSAQSICALEASRDYLNTQKHIISQLEESEARAYFLAHCLDTPLWPRKNPYTAEMRIQASDERTLSFAATLSDVYDGMVCRLRFDFDAKVKPKSLRLDPIDTQAVVGDIVVRLFTEDGRNERAYVESTNASISGDGLLYFVTDDPIIYFRCNQFDAAWSRAEITYTLVNVGATANGACLKVLKRRSDGFVPIHITRKG